MARIKKNTAKNKRIKEIPYEEITAQQLKVLTIISDMNKFFQKPEDQLVLRGKSNPTSKFFDWNYLRYDVDNIIICFENFAPGYSANNTEDEIYKIVIGSYFKAKQQANKVK